MLRKEISMNELNDINNLINNNLHNIKWRKVDKRRCEFQALQKLFKHENKSYCFSNETFHACKHLVKQSAEERWDQVLKNYTIDLETPKKIKEQFRVNSCEVNKYYSDVGKKVMKERYAIIKENSMSTSNKKRIGFLGKGDCEGVLVYSTFDNSNSSVEFNTIFRARESNGCESNNYIVNAYLHIMEKEEEIKWIVYPVEIRYLNDIYEVLFKLQSIDKLYMLLNRRVQKLVSIAEETGYIDDIFEAIKVLVLFESYEYNPVDDKCYVLRKLRNLMSVRNRIDQIFKKNAINTNFNEQYEQFYNLTRELGNRIELLLIEEEKEIEYYNFLVWNFCYDWTCLNIIYNKLEGLDSKLNPSDILMSINFNDNNFYKKIKEAHKKAWKLNNCKNLKFY